MPDELINMLSQQGFHFDSQSLQDSFNMAVSWMVFHMGQYLHARLGHNYCQLSSLT